jgi:zinc transporter ZupT
MFSDILIKSILVVLSALAGAGLVTVITLNHKKLCGLISFSAGALFSAAVFTLLPESAGYIGWFEILLSVASGYLLFWLISKYFSHVCPACSATHFDEQTTHKFSEIVLTLLTALSIHSFLDGVAITSGLEHDHQNEAVFYAVLTHKFPEGLALAALMISSGYNKMKIFIYVALVESVTILGALAGYFIFREGVSPVVFSAVMAHVAGGFIFLALHAVLGEMLKNHKNLVIFSFLGGLAVILLVNLIQF